MAHKPVIETQKRGIVGINQVGVFYKNKKFVKIMESGDSPGFFEGRLSDTEIFVVDITPHDFTLRISIPSKNTKDQFSLLLGLSYKVVDPKKMIEDDVKDTEVVITRELEKTLRKIGKEYAFIDYRIAEDAFVQALKQLELSETIGLQFTNDPSVQIYMDDDDHKRIKFLNEVERSKKVPRQIEYTARVPSKDPAKYFEVTAAIDYRVSNVEDLPSDNLDDPVKYLWSRIEKAIKRGARNYQISDINGADLSMQDEVDLLFKNHELRDFGIEILHVNVTTDIAEEERKKYQEINDKRHQNLVKKEELSIADVYNEYVLNGKFDALVLAVNNGELKLKELYEIMNEAQKEQFEMQMKVIDKVAEHDFLDQGNAERIASNVSNSVIGQYLDSGEGKTARKEQLTSGKQEKEEINENDLNVKEEKTDEQ